jgi:hypothetical protein
VEEILHQLMGGKHPITIPLPIGFLWISTIPNWWCRNSLAHPQYDDRCGFRQIVQDDFVIFQIEVMIGDVIGRNMPIQPAFPGHQSFVAIIIVQI